tara:strand:- start:1550 stop:1951 length:402 start_codon:yes stop_codon:yes gene_type:complete
MAFRQNYYNHVIAVGGSAASANNVARASNPGKALAEFERAFAAQKAEADANYQRNLAADRMREQQNRLMAAIAQGPPKANKSLRSAEYQPKFKAAASKTESKRATSRGTYQFSNPLGMGGAAGSRTGGMGGLA